jgi:hypothetical protein
VVGGIAMIVADHLREGAAAALVALAPELVEMTLVPYIGRELARDWARRGGPAGES